MNIEITEHKGIYSLNHGNTTININQNELIELYYEINEIILNNDKLWEKIR